MPYLIALLLLAGVIWLVSEPLRRGGGSAPGPVPAYASMQRADLEAARDAKYREIRDAELDHQTGKLSAEDYAAIDASLRAEAVTLLHQIDALDLEPEDFDDHAPGTMAPANRTRAQGADQSIE